MKQKPSTAVSLHYGQLLADIKARVHAAQIRAGLAANRELLVLYWDIGRMILDRQKAEGWGAKVIDRLSRDLQNEFPGQQGFSPRNLKYMRAFADAWPETVIVQQPVAQLAGSGKVIMHPPDAQTSQPKSAMVQASLAQSSRTVAAIVQQPAAQIPWTHHCLLLDKLSSSQDRLWYAAKALENGWSRPILALQIESRLHTRQGKALTNFMATLPPPQSDLAQQITKDPYVFDFLNLRDAANERAVEDALMAHVEKFLLELGVGFALAGRQVHMEVGDQDFYVDLLFYHLKLRCFVVVDLKARDFTPEAAGKMNFYLSAVDDRFRQSADQPSIGLILCRAKNRIIAEYALRDLHKPIGVSDYVTRLVESLPKELQASVPSVKEIESGLAPAAEPLRPRKPKIP
jgi:predicted nuclease of restriction endonuclease-like (RecB) superfamily